MATDNTAWQLEDFVDSLVVELDKTRETLAVKAINKPLTYTVKEMTLDLNIFPSYDGDRVSFVTAQPGQQGASKVSIQLGSITDQQVRATTKVPETRNDVRIDAIDVDQPTKKKLRKLGVQSVGDLKQIEKKNVNLQNFSDETIDFNKLASRIRAYHPPVVRAVSLDLDEEHRPVLTVRGENLVVDGKFSPVAVVNQTLAEVQSWSEQEMRIQVGKEHAISQSNEIVLTVDPYAVIKVNAKIR